MLTLLTIFTTTIVVGFGFWFYNRRQINNLNQIIDDKSAIISTLQSHIDKTTDNTTDSLSETVNGVSPERKKNRYNNRQKKKTNGEQSSQNKNTQKRGGKPQSN